MSNVVTGPWANTISFPTTHLKQHHQNECVFMIDRDHPRWEEFRQWLHEGSIEFTAGQSGIINIWWELTFKHRRDAALFKLTFC